MLQLDPMSSDYAPSRSTREQDSPSSDSRPVTVINLPEEMVRIAFTDASQTRLRELVRIALGGPFASTDRATLLGSAAEARILVTGWGSTQLSSADLARFSRLELVVHVGGSLRYTFPELWFPDNLRICSAARVNARPVAEYTLGVILTALRGILQAGRSPTPLREEKYPPVARNGFAERTIAVVGFGLIARHLLEILRPFGFRLLVVSDFVTPDDEKQWGIERVDLATAAREADVLSLHESNLPAFDRMINEPILGLMRDHAILINTARGNLLDEQALARSLRERPLFAVLDVLNQEPPPEDHPLCQLPNCLITPHIAGSQGAEVKRFGDYLVREIENHLAGRPYENELPRETLATRA